MKRPTDAYRLQIVEIYYENSQYVKNLQLRPYYGLHNLPGELTIRAVITKFPMLDNKPLSRMRKVIAEERIEDVVSSVNENHEMSIRRRFYQ